MDPKIDFYCMATLGRIAINWAFSEHILEDLIAGMLGAEPQHINALTANMATDYQIRSARTIARMRFDDLIFAQFDSALSQFEDLVSFRNKLIHGFWAEYEDSDIWTVSTVKSTGKLRYQSEYVNFDYLEWMEKQVRRVATLLIAFGEQHGLLSWSDASALPGTLSSLAALGGPDRAV
jgi:hypothetical protein